MTPPPDFRDDDPDDLLAAEYVLGLLDGDAWFAVRARAERDGAFAARVQAWEQRLAPLNEGFAPAPAPDLMPAIEARLFPRGARPRARRGMGWRWLGATGLVGALALGLVVLSPVLRAPAPPALVAELTAPDRGLVLQARFDPAGNALSVRAQGPAAGPGQDYELWAIDAAGTPRSLGVLRGDAAALRAELAAGEVLAVSLEPEGGAPGAAPTGPVLATAPLQAG